MSRSHPAESVNRCGGLFLPPLVPLGVNGGVFLLGLRLVFRPNPVGFGVECADVAVIWVEGRPHDMTGSL